MSDQALVIFSGISSYLISNYLHFKYSKFLGNKKIIGIDRSLKKQRLEGINYRAVETDIANTAKFFETFSNEIKEAKKIFYIHALRSNNIEAEEEFCKSLITLNQSIQAVLFSSSAVYGENEHKEACQETDELKPISDYGKYKVMQEEFFEDIFSHPLILRISNPYAGLYAEKGAYRHFKEAIENKSPIKLNCETEGQIQRDFLSMDEFISTLDKALSAELKGFYNISSGKNQSLEDFATALAKDLNLEVNFQYIGFKIADIKYSVLSNYKLKNALKNAGYL